MVMMFHNSRVTTRRRGSIPTCVPCFETKYADWRARMFKDHWGFAQQSSADHYIGAVQRYMAGGVKWEDISRDIRTNL